jgi:hypothetical protein
MTLRNMAGAPHPVQPSFLNRPYCRTTCLQLAIAALLSGMVTRPGGPQLLSPEEALAFCTAPADVLGSKATGGPASIN